MEKLERISITLMNKTLIPVITKNEATDFFCIPKANHEILSWLFNHTAIPTLVLAQNEGQLLQVLGIGRFGVEWHLSAKYETTNLYMDCQVVPMQQNVAFIVCRRKQNQS